MIGKKIKEMRQARNLTQTALADLMGKHQPCVARWEAGKRPSLSNLMQIAKIFDVTMDELVREGNYEKDIGQKDGVTVEDNADKRTDGST